jgi:hypothetical protein
LQTQQTAKPEVVELKTQNAKLHQQVNQTTQLLRQQQEETQSQVKRTEESNKQTALLYVFSRSLN